MNFNHFKGPFMVSNVSVTHYYSLFRGLLGIPLLKYNRKYNAGSVVISSCEVASVMQSLRPQNTSVE